MPQPTDPPIAESMPVQLTRMEGVLNLVLERTNTLTHRMDRAEDRVAALEATTQRLDLDALSRDKTAVALALALKEAKEAVEATARAKSAEASVEAARSERAWSPVMRLAAILGSVVTIAGVIIAAYAASKTGG